MQNRIGDGRAFTKLQEGLLVLADISGYTTFVAKTEVDHSWEILHELLETMVRSVEGTLDVSQVEGDAILFISGLTDDEVVKALDNTFVCFHRRLRDMQTVTTCPCNACANIGILKLKFVVHRGSFSRQRLGAVEQLHGTDVIVAHRLLKNQVPSKEYLLVTQAVLERLPADRQSRFTPYTETYDLGPISGGYEQISHLWDEAEAAERRRVAPEEAMIDNEVEVDASIEVVWEGMLEPAVMTRYLMADSVDEFAGARGQDLGSEFHCHHGAGVNYLRVIAVDPGRETTLVSTSPAGDLYVTTRFTVGSAGRTRVRRLFWWEPPPDPEVAAAVKEMVEAIVVGGGTELQAVFAVPAQAGAST
jgi:uncharacterized protein YndB with AHSA1/START domain